MPSARETYKTILVQNLDVDGTRVFTSKSLNCEGRGKVTFLIFCDVDCEFTVEWSWDGANNWYPLANSTNVAVTANLLKRITFDDCFTYLRLVVQNFAGVGILGAWNIAL